MLTSFFGKSKPINFFAILFVMATFYIWANFSNISTAFSIATFFQKVGVSIIFLLSIPILNFIAKKNELTKDSAYKILIFSVFTISFFQLLQNNQVIIANFCLLLSLRRIISLRTYKDVEKKIFDATFWICIASLFYFWLILFIAVVYFGILMHSRTNFKNWLIPFVGFGAVAMLVTSFHIIFYNQFYTPISWYEMSNFDFSAYRNFEILIPLSIILALAVWSLFFYMQKIQKASILARASLLLVLVSFFTAIFVAIFAPHKNGAELIFFFVPLSIIMSNYLEHKRERVFKEIILLIVILMPFVVGLFL